MTTANPSNRLAFVDAHTHLYDSRVVPYGIFSRIDPVFEALVGDYTALPRIFLLDDYLRATSSRKAVGIVWHEFISDDTLKEMAWSERLAVLRIYRWLSSALSISPALAWRNASMSIEPFQT